jgi:iron complex transport system ATP-binding protein
MLEVSDLGITLSGRRLLSGISFRARPGDVTAIIGPNGSGKTTLLRALTGELPPEGDVRLNGLDIRATPPHRLAAFRAVLAQSTQVAFPFTAGEIVRLGLEAGSGLADPGLVPRLLAEVDLPGTMRRPYHQLSGGEQARVQLARVLAQARQPVTATGPGWLFLDEPVASLDIAHQLMVMRIARGFADTGGGVVMVLHDLNLTAMVADRVLLLKSGGVLAQGTPDEVLTDDLLGTAFGCQIRVGTAPLRGPWLVPQSTGAAL